MKSSTWKLWTIPLIAASALWSADDKAIEEFIKGNVARNPKVTLQSMEVTERVPVPGVKGWEAVLFKMNLEIDRGGKKSPIDTSDIIFTSGDVVASDLFHLKKKQSMKNLVRPGVKAEHYRDDRLVSGAKGGKAPYKLVVFSDPQCPFCMDYVPDIIALAKAHPDKVSLYYYHMPLPSLHPAAPVIVRAATALELKGEKNVMERVYAAEMESRTPDEKTVLEEFNKKMGSKLTSKDINAKAVLDHVEEDQRIATELMVRGTPTIFVNGEYDGDKKMFENLKERLK